MQILVAGIGNIFLGDDGFGTEVARRLALRPLPQDIKVVDFGIRGMDLAFALMDGYAALILIDAAARGEAPGTLSLIEHEWDWDGASVSVEVHAMDPVKVLRLAAMLGASPIPTFIVACEPAFIGGADGYEDVVAALSEPVKSALDGAIEMVRALLDRLITANAEGGELICVGERLY